MAPTMSSRWTSWKHDPSRKQMGGRVQAPSLVARLSRLQAGALLVVLAVAAVLRFSNLAWDGLQHTHPDERYINWAATTLSLDGGLPVWLNPTASGLNPFYWPEQKHTAGIQVPLGEPRRFAYGHFPFYLMGGVAAVLDKLGGWLPALDGLPLVRDLANTVGRVEFNHLTLVGRALSAAADMATVLLTFCLGRRAFGPWAGILGAAFVSVTVLHIQLSHFGTFDTILTAAVMATLWAASRYAEEPSLKSALLVGGLVGLAVGSKASAGLLAAPVGAALLWAHTDALSTSDRRALASGIIRAATAVGVTAAAVFALTNPFALLQFGEYVANIKTQSLMVRGALDWFFVSQYRDTLPYWYPISQQFNWVWGPPLAMVGYAGAILVLVQFVRAFRHGVGRRTSPVVVVLLSWAIPYLLVTGAFVVKFPRYLLPITPVIMALGAGGLTGVARARRQAWVIVPAVLLPTLLYAIAFARMYSSEHPWVQASRWIYANAPARTSIVLERLDDPLPFNTIDGVQYSRETYYRVAKIDPWALPDDDEKIGALLETVSRADYLVIASNRMYGVIPRLTTRYALTGRYYEALFSGELGFDLVYSATRSPHLGGVWIAPDPLRDAGLPYPRGMNLPGPSLRLGFADESFTVYDQPRVFVFQNSQQLPATRLRAQLHVVAP